MTKRSDTSLKADDDWQNVEMQVPDFRGGVRTIRVKRRDMPTETRTVSVERSSPDHLRIDASKPS